MGKPFDSLGIGNKVPTYLIENCALYFGLGHTILAERLDNVHICRPNITEENIGIIKSIPSLLGIDFIKRYSIKYEDNFVYLER